MERRRLENERAQQINQQSRLRMDLQRRQNIGKLLASKAEEARKIMEEHVRNREAITLQKQKELERAIEMRTLVQQHLAESRENRERMITMRREEAKRSFQERLQEEAERSQEYERRVQMMEEEERRLIAALAEAQEEQRRAYAELEQALLASKQKQLQVYHEYQSGSPGSTSRRAGPMVEHSQSSSSSTQVIEAPSTTTAPAAASAAAAPESAPADDYRDGFEDPSSGHM